MVFAGFLYRVHGQVFLIERGVSNIAALRLQYMHAIFQCDRSS